MAALLVRAVLGHGQVLEIYEGGECRLIDSQGRQEIKLNAGAGLDLLHVLEQHKELLTQSRAHSEGELEQTYGRAADYSEHKRHEWITYTPAEGGPARTGLILWVCAPSRAGDRELPLRYIVAPDVDAGLPDIVFPGDVIEE